MQFDGPRKFFQPQTRRAKELERWARSMRSQLSSRGAGLVWAEEPTVGRANWVRQKPSLEDPGRFSVGEEKGRGRVASGRPRRCNASAARVVFPVPAPWQDWAKGASGAGGTRRGARLAVLGRACGSRPAFQDLVGVGTSHRTLCVPRKCFGARVHSTRCVHPLRRRCSARSQHLCKAECSSSRTCRRGWPVKRRESIAGPMAQAIVPSLGGQNKGAAAG